MIPPDVLAAIEPYAGAVRSASPVGGGDVSRAARLDAARGRFFLKWGRGDAGRTYAAEAEGLAALRAAAEGTGLVVPAPLAARDSAGGAAGFVLLDWIEPARPAPGDWRAFGAALAALHRAEAPGVGYGWDRDNWIGSKPQRNGWDASWPSFFGERRLRAQAATVSERGAWDAAWDAPLDRLVARLPEVLPAAPPRSLLHGDLWGGNVLATEDGAAHAPSPGVFALIDPAVSVGHREADLAMTELFGGFAGPFYDGYREGWPLEPGYPERREVYNLYHLVNHLTHGPSYRRPVERVLRRFGGGS